MTPFPLEQPVRSQLKKFGHGFEVPISVVHMDVPQVGGQLGEFPFDVEPRTIPVDQGADGKSMTHVHQPWTTAPTLGSRAETDSLTELGESVFRRRTGNPAPAFGDEKGTNERCWEKAISGFGVLF